MRYNKSFYNIKIKKIKLFENNYKNKNQKNAYHLLNKNNNNYYKTNKQNLKIK